MDIILVSLRLIHIVAAFVWVGLGIAATFYVIPAAQKSGESGLRFFKSLLNNTNFGTMFAVVSGLTTLAGILLYIFADSASRFSTTGNMVLGIGALAGLIATIHGGAVVGRNTRVLDAELAESIPDDQAIPADTLTKINGMVAQLASHSRISLVLMIVALVFMSSARYL